MKKFATAVVALAIMATSALAEVEIIAEKVNENLDVISHKSRIWTNTKFTPVTLYPQTTIRFNDAKANELNQNNTPIIAAIAAIYNKDKIAFMIKWPDVHQDYQKSDSTDAYADAFAVQFARNFSIPKELPYIGMGSVDRPVIIHLQKDSVRIYEPNGNGDIEHQINPNQTNLFNKDLEAFEKQVINIGVADYERSFISEGFRSMTQIKDGTSHSHSTIGYSGIGWLGTVSRSLKDSYLDLDAVAIPVSFAVWNGGKLGRNGLKYLTPWLAIRLKKGESELVKSLTEVPTGDPVAGIKSMTTYGCKGCHQVTANDRENFMAPALKSIGGYSTADYLRESLVNPSAVVVPGYNRNAHSKYKWYTLRENNKRVSTTPDYSWLDPQELENMVAYLKTLKGGNE